MEMVKGRKYLVTCGNGDIFACTSEEIDKNNDKGAEFKTLRVELKSGRIYLAEEEPSYEELYGGNNGRD